MGHITPNITHAAFRGRDDDVGLNSSTFTYAKDTDWTQDADAVFRIRILLQEDAGGALNDKYKLQYRIDTGGGYGSWTDVSGTTEVQPDLSGNYADGDGTSTQLLGSGSYVTGDGVEGTAVTLSKISLAGNDETEVEFALTLDSAQVSTDDTIQLRCRSLGSPTYSDTVIAEITANVALSQTGRVTALDAQATTTQKTARATALDIEATHSLKTARATAVDIEATYSEKTARITAVDHGITYTPIVQTGRITALDIEETHSEKTGHVTALDHEVTTTEKTGKITAVDHGITYTPTPQAGRITAIDHEVTHTEKTVRVTAADAQATYTKKAAQVTALDIEATFETVKGRIAALDIGETHTEVTAQVTALDAEETHTEKTVRVTAVDHGITYTPTGAGPQTGKVTALDTEITYSEKTVRITALDLEETHTEKAARITAADIEVTTTQKTGHIVALDQGITHTEIKGRITALDHALTLEEIRAQVTALDKELTYDAHPDGKAVPPSRRFVPNASIDFAGQPIWTPDPVVGADSCYQWVDNGLDNIKWDQYLEALAINKYICLLFYYDDLPNDIDRARYLYLNMAYEGLKDGADNPGVQFTLYTDHPGDYSRELGQYNPTTNFETAGVQSTGGVRIPFIETPPVTRDELSRLRVLVRSSGAAGTGAKPPYQW